MRFKSIWLYIAMPVLIISLLVAGYFYLSNKNKVLPSPQPTTQPEITPAPTPPPAAQPTQPPQPQESSLPAGWNTYTNSTYNFEISYPSNYQALDDSENLYGWPNGVVLIYGGGQSYDIAIEVWNSETEYQYKYPNGVEKVYPVGNKFLTAADITKEAENSDIISTFKLTN